ncbi:hypothetical protein AUR64_00060 [Haloprofundus marisrubri]|uniref:Uncharacterized protein n=1 Tax=Haloprofundus marisrubri TaxID=1514971 RepID=A0A0W1RDY4_9EURY|nr:hypothetical protein [Haloprofundus marisrubri]KTG11624.1 hypothetical protein AUR64_00060 [Haloprofundus marisrubri]
MAPLPRTALLRTHLRERSASMAAGYAMAGAAFAAVAVFVVLSGAVSVLDYVQTDPQVRNTALQFLFPLLGVVAAVFVTPAAFLVGVVTWRRFVPAAASARRGAVAGVVTVLGSYVLAGFGVSVAGVVVIFVENVNSALFFDQWSLAELVEGTPRGAWAGVVAAGYGLVLTWWLTLPLGAVAGWRHQRRA